MLQVAIEVPAVLKPVFSAILHQMSLRLLVGNVCVLLLLSLATNSSLANSLIREIQTKPVKFGETLQPDTPHYTQLSPHFT